MIKGVHQCAIWAPPNLDHIY